MHKQKKSIMHATPYFYIICGASQTKLYNLCKNYTTIKIREKSATAFAAADFDLFFQNDLFIRRFVC